MPPETNASAETATNTNAANVAPTVTTPIVDNDKEPDVLPPWFAKRLEQGKRVAAKEAEAAARKAQLAELGFDDPEVAKKLAAEEKKRAEERKSLETKLAERDVALNAKDARNKELEESAKSYADTLLAGLTEQQRAAVVAVAGTDPPKQLKAIEHLRPTWTVATPTTQTPTSQETTSAAKPANAAPPVVVPQKPAPPTGPGQTAPPQIGSTATPNHLETYERLNNQNSPDYRPFAAAAHLLVHGREIEEARKARGKN